MDKNQQLKALCDEYAAQLPDKLTAIRLDWSTLIEKNDRHLLKELIRKAHNLIGSGATFGFSELSEVAAQLENILRQYQEHGMDDAFRPDDVERLLLNLEQAALRPPNYDFPATRTPSLIKAPTAQHDSPCVLFISDNEELSSELASKLEAYDIKIEVLSPETDLVTHIKKTNYRCVLVEISSAHTREHEIASFKHFRESLPHPPELVIISDRDDMPTRLSAVRAGALDCFITPVIMPKLIKLMRDLCNPLIKPPYRILLVDDDVQFAHHTALTLQNAGMKTMVVTDPMSLLGPLASFQPELILLDLHMPACDGLELAAVIRQQNMYTGISIVFFSVETDINRHIDAFRSGGNDFFIKGMPPQQLIAKVEAKAVHTRAVQSLMLNDPLTGLSNRTYFTAVIGKQMASCLRNKGRFSYVMLDLDHFKQVNDQFGHQAGDEVLRTLGSLITQRLRSVDTAVRFGGEEFVILLAETKLEQALMVINDLLKKISAVTFTANKRSFSVTFSAGIAEYPGYPDQTSLAEAADKALYRAKAEGRNRVYLAETNP